MPDLNTVLLDRETFMNRALAPWRVSGGKDLRL